jgi:LPXTG-motif cell wall-anchored protein
MATAKEIPYSFGPGRSINSLLFGTQPIDLKKLVTGQPSYANPQDFIDAKNLAVLTTLDVKNYDLPASHQYNVPAIASYYGVDPSQVKVAQDKAAVLYPQILKGRTIDQQGKIIGDVALALIAAAWAFLGAEAAALLATPAETLPAGVEGPVRPLTTTQTAGNYASRGLTVSSYGLAIGQGAKVAIDIFGQKVGSIITAALTGDFASALQIAVSPGPKPPPVSNLGAPPVNYPSGGGGGGGIALGNTGQTSTPMVFYVGLAVIGVLILYLVVRKK